MASSEVGNNIVAILTELPDRRTTVRRIVERIGGLGSEGSGKGAHYQRYYGS